MFHMENDMKVKKQLLGRLLQLILLLVVLSFLTFMLMYLAPGDPAEKKLSSQGVAISQEVLEAERERLGLNRPPLIRYVEWFGGILHGDFGLSLTDDQPIGPRLMQGLSNTLVLALSSLLAALVVSIPLGILSAVKQNSILDNIVKILSFIGNALPNFLISVLMMYLFCIVFKIFPVVATNSFNGLFLPAISLAIPMAGRFTRQIRAEIISQLDSDYVTGLRTRGVKEKDILLKNVFYNASPHIFTIIALQIGTLMGGSVIIENIFRWPGIGRLVMEAINGRDYTTVSGFVLIMGTIYVIINFLSDTLQQSIDPRSNQ